MFGRTVAEFARLAGCILLAAPLAAQDDDPLAYARERAAAIANLEAGVPAACYTKTEGRHNPCWVCHTQSDFPNTTSDWTLQTEYAFSSEGRENRWTNLFKDRRAEIATIGDAEILAYIRTDNYGALREAMAKVEGYAGFRPDLDIEAGFDAQGFARDGTRWRAIRYRPFPGTFWPTNGSTDDVFIRLPIAFATDEAGMASRPVEIENYAILERAVRDGVAAKGERYRGAAKGIAVRAGLYPEGVEFLHTVRYLDPERSTLMARRLKEVRYSKKVRDLDAWSLLRAEERESEERQNGRLPRYTGAALEGIENGVGWRLQGFIEDRRGRLRLQTEEETRFCMGCHSHLGVTIDQTFALPRKLPGDDGWRHQDLNGQRDVPQKGHAEPEILTYFKRSGGGDELRANDEVAARFWKNGVLDEALVKALGAGENGLLALVGPSRQRALALNKAYLAVVREQSYSRGRDAVPSPATNVHTTVPEDIRAFTSEAFIFRDGSLRLAFPRR